MSEDRVDLKGLFLPISDIERRELDSSYSVGELANLFIDFWVPYLECQKCGRHDYCKFTKPHPYPEPRSVGRLAEIRCGVVTTMITNYVHGTFPLLAGFRRDELQHFLDASYHLVAFVYQAEQQIGRMIDNDMVDFFGTAEYKAFFFGMTAQLRRHLDGFAAELQEIKAFRTKTTVILTEGASEMMFLRKLKESRLAAYMHLNVQSYYGKGERRRGKLVALAKHLRQQGYQLFVQADRDGKSISVLQDIVNKGIVEQNNTFEFEVDFETAFPANVLFKALMDMDMLSDIRFEDFEAEVSKRKPGESVLSVIEASYLIKVNKIELAEALGTVLNRPFGYPHDSSPFWSTEAGKFMDLVSRLP